MSSREIIKFYPLVDLSNPEKPRLDFQSKVSAFLKALKCNEHGKRIILTLEPYFKERTVDQNRFYWGIFLYEEIECFKEYWGEEYSKEEMHEWNKANFWGEEKLIESTMEIIRTPASSTGKNTVEWEEKLEKIRQWFRQRFDWEISYPDEQKKLKFKY